MARKWPWKWIALAAVLVVEVAALVAVVLLGQGEPTSGLAVPWQSTALVVANQRGVVHEITVDRVMTPVNAWIVVQADAGNSTPGAIVGSTWVGAGESHDVIVQLDPKQPVPKRPFVTLVADTGMPHELEYSASSAGGSGGMGGSAGSDLPLVVDGGYVVARPTLAAASVTVGSGQASIAETSRTVDATAVVIPRVVAPAQSWVVVSVVATAGAPAQVLGATLVQSGTHTQVVVALDTPPGKKPLAAALHADLGTLGRFEYSPSDPANSPDQPYVAAGKPVAVAVTFAR